MPDSSKAGHPAPPGRPAGATAPNPPSQCFVSYAHHDKPGFDRLLVHLTPLTALYGFRIWHDQRINPGFYWNDEILGHLRQSQIFVLLTTNDFLASDYILRYELPAIIEQHKQNDALVLPVIYRECAWHGFFGGYIQAVPSQNGRLRPVHDWKDREKALAISTNAISDSIREWFGVTPTSPFAGASP